MTELDQVDTEIVALKAILAEDYFALESVGDKCDGFETVHIRAGRKKRWHTEKHVVTRTPSGRFYEWTWQAGATECQESYGPANLDDCGPDDVELRLVQETTVEVTEWVPENA